MDDARVTIPDARVVEGTVVAQLPSGLYTIEVEGLRKDKAVVTADGKTIASETLRREAGTPCRFGVGAGGGTVEFMNLYARDL